MSFWRSSLRGWQPYMAEFLDRSLLFTQFFCCINVFTNHVAQIHQVMGPSMLPTLSTTGDVLLLERVSTRFQKIKPGDVVMALSPENPRLIVCKRVLGLEGDRIVANSRGLVQNVVVPRGHVWLQGDNASNSTDSRHYGPVPYALLQGKVCLRDLLHIYSIFISLKCLMEGTFKPAIISQATGVVF